jgi:uncharacterized protein
MPRAVTTSPSTSGTPPEKGDGGAPSDQPRRVKPMGRGAWVEAVRLWAIAFGAIIVGRLFPIDLKLFTINAKLVAAVAFLYLPGVVVWRRDEDYRDYGATLTRWKKDLALGLGACGVVLPLFAGGFYGYAALLNHLPQWGVELLGPYQPQPPHFVFRVPDKFWQHIIDQFLVVALSEEFFYRGFMQSRLRDSWPQGRTIFGVRLGPAFWITQILFAVGHLAEFHFWRLGVFFPAIVFGALRERSGTIVPSTIFHAMSNLTVMVLEASFFGR